jgi:alanine dehydrogenase
MQLAGKGWKRALKDNPSLLKGLNITDGKVTYPGVAEAFGMELHDPSKLLG